jgi:hypothetical protein
VQGGGGDLVFTAAGDVESPVALGELQFAPRNNAPRSRGGRRAGLLPSRGSSVGPSGMTFGQNGTRRH